MKKLEVFSAFISVLHGPFLNESVHFWEKIFIKLSDLAIIAKSLSKYKLFFQKCPKPFEIFVFHNLYVQYLD